MNNIELLANCQCNVNKSDFADTLATCKRRLRLAYNGKYINQDDYLSDESTEPTRKRLVDANKLSPEMKEAYDKHCKGCINESCDWCKYNGCWDTLFNPLPEGFMAFALTRTPYKRQIVRNECTEYELKHIVELYKTHFNHE